MRWFFLALLTACGADPCDPPSEGPPDPPTEECSSGVVPDGGNVP